MYLKNIFTKTENIWLIFIMVYLIGDTITFIYLIFFDGYIYNWWNWIIAVPINVFLSNIWPIYWLILVPFN